MGFKYGQRRNQGTNEKEGRLVVGCFYDRWGPLHRKHLEPSLFFLLTLLCSALLCLVDGQSYIRTVQRPAYAHKSQVHMNLLLKNTFWNV
jgi:hypothetical protein